MKFNVTVLSFLICASLYAVESRAEVEAGHWVFGADLTFGGDELGGTYDINTGEKIEDLTAGGLIYVYGGYDFILSQDSFSSMGLRTTLGWHFDSVSADNGDIYFDRYPLNLIVHQKFNSIDLGAGITYHINPILDQSDTGFGNISFDNSLGFRVEVGYELNFQTELTASATVIDYKGSGIEDISGNNVGIGFRFIF